VRTARLNASAKLGRVEGPALTVTIEGDPVDAPWVPLALTIAKVLDDEGEEPEPGPEPEPAPDAAVAVVVATPVLVPAEAPAAPGEVDMDMDIDMDMDMDEAIIVELGDWSHGVVRVAVAVSVTVATPPPPPLLPTIWKFPQVRRVTLA
jgi:hypothetical protein